MPSVFENLLTAGQTALRSTAGLIVTFYRGSASVDVTAIRGKSDWELDQGNGAAVKTQTVDWIIAGADLEIESVAITPRAGDQIKLTEGGFVKTYEIAAPGGANAVEPSGPSNYRIHSQLIKTETV